MTEEQVLDVLQNVGAFRAGHFVFTSGRHSDSYVNKDAIFTNPAQLSGLCEDIAMRFKDDGVEAVIGPAVAAALMAQWTAYHLTLLTGRTVYATYADKDGEGGFTIKRGYDKIISGKKVLVVEDLTTTGGSVRKVVDAARSAGANVIGATVLCNRGNVSAEQAGNPGKFESLVHLDLESWDEATCELCQSNIPINTELGHGKAFLAKKAD